MTPSNTWSKARPYDNLRSHADVWSSEDGISWTRIVDKGPWQPRMWPTLSVKNNLLWMFGGFNNETNANLNTLWVSPNARDWYPVDFRNGPSARHFATAIAVDEGIVLAAGNTWPVVNDVWLLRTPKYLVDLDLRAMWRKVRDSYQRWREQ